MGRDKDGIASLAAGCWCYKQTPLPIHRILASSQSPGLRVVLRTEQPAHHSRPLPFAYFSPSPLIAAWLLAAARYIITCNYCPLKLSPGPCLLCCPGLHWQPTDFPIRVSTNGQRAPDRGGLTAAGQGHHLQGCNLLGGRAWCSSRSSPL